LLGYIGMITGAAWLMKLRNYPGYKKAFHIVTVLFALSYIAYPAYDMKNMLRKGEDVYIEAMQLKKLGLSGSFTANNNPSTATITAAYTNMSYFTLDRYDIPPQNLLSDMRRYRVKYYLFYYKAFDGPSIAMKDEKGQPFPEISAGSTPGLKIFLINP